MKTRSPGDPDWSEMMVQKVEMSFATGDKEVGEEYLSKNSLTPLRICSKVNNTSFSVFPGFTKIKQSSSSIPLADLNRFHVLKTAFSS